MKKREAGTWLFEQYKKEHPEAVPEKCRQHGHAGTAAWERIKPVFAVLLVNAAALFLAAAMNPEVKLLFRKLLGT